MQKDYFRHQNFSTVSRISADISEEMDYKSSVTPTKCSPKEGMFLSLEKLENLMVLNLKLKKAERLFAIYTS